MHAMDCKLERLCIHYMFDCTGSLFYFELFPSSFLKITQPNKIHFIDTAWSVFYLVTFVLTVLNLSHLTKMFSFFSPCFDEPNFKATFNITLEFPNGFTALANTKEKEKVIVF